MVGPEESIVAHYGKSGLYRQIIAALTAAGLSEAELTPDDLKAVDEFHIGGIAATRDLLDPLGFGPQTKVLDIGCGIGGPVRFMAATYGCAVMGLDLTPDFIDTARQLTRAVGLSAEFIVGSALDLPFEPESFDAATLIHVGMNLPDKSRLFSEAARVLVPGGVFAVYDVMRFGAHPEFPLPWSSTPEASFLEAPAAYLAAADAAGLTLTHRADKGDVARVFFAEMQARMAEAGPPAAGLPLLMGDTAPQKVANMVTAVAAGDIQPVEMIFKKG